MEWTCSTCEQQATAADWGLLATIGWRRAADGSVRCSLCAKAPPSRLLGLEASALRTPPSRRVVAP